MNSAPILPEIEEPTFELDPSPDLRQAFDEIAKPRPEMDQDDIRNCEEAWSILANEFVGQGRV